MTSRFVLIFVPCVSISVGTSSMWTLTTELSRSRIRAMEFPPATAWDSRQWTEIMMEEANIAALILDLAGGSPLIVQKLL